MDDNKSITYTFGTQPIKDQHSILELCMRQDEIPWKTLLAKLFPEFKTDEFVTYMINKYKESLDDQSTLPTPTKKTKVASNPISNDNRLRRWSLDNSPIGRRNLRQQAIHEAEVKLRAMKASTAWDTTEETLSAADQRHDNVNTLRGNIEVNTTVTHRLMAHSHLQWINSEGDSVVDNAVKIVHTMMNWYNVPVTTDKVTSIPHIREMDRTAPLVASVREFSADKSIILTPGTKTFDELLSCKNADTNPILIVAEATKHDKETNDTKMVSYPQFIVLMLLIQDEPHFILPGSKTN